MDVHLTKKSNIATLTEKETEEIITPQCALNSGAYSNEEDNSSNNNELTEHWRKVFIILLNTLLCGSDEITEEITGIISSHIMHGDYEIGNVIKELILFRKRIMKHLQNHLGHASPKLVRTCSEMDNLFESILCFVSQRHADMMNEQLRVQQEHTEMLLELVEQAASTLDLDEVLDSVRTSICKFTNTSFCGFSIIDEERAVFIPRSGTKNYNHDPSRIFEYPDAPIQPLTNLIDSGRYMVEHQVPVILNRAEIEECVQIGWTHFNGFHSILGIPFSVKGRLVAIAHACSKDKNHHFSKDQIAKTWGMAKVVALAIDNARLHNAKKELAVLEERERLAREMHDNLAQTVGALQLKASLIAGYIDDTGNREAQQHISQLQEIIGEVYTDIREMMFRIRTNPASEKCFLSTLRGYLKAYQSKYGIYVQLEAPARIHSIWNTNTCIQVLHIIQEALTNIRKHAKTDRAVIRIKQTGTSLQISIHDYGCGFDRLSSNVSIGDHMGLSIMHERSKSIGGSLEVKSSHGEGTTILLNLSL